MASKGPFQPKAFYDSVILRFGHRCLVLFCVPVPMDEAILLVNGRYLLNVLVSLTLHTELQLSCVRYGVWGPAACRGRDSETPLVGALAVCLCSCSYAATCFSHAGNVHSAGDDWLACLLSDFSGGLFSKFFS